MTRDARPRVVVAGGGVAALEACLALRAALEADALAVDLLSPVARFELRPLSVLEPFDATPAWGMDLASFAEDQDLHVVRDGLSGVDVGARAVVTTSGGRLGFDHLLVATGAEPVRAVPGAVTFRGGRDADAVRALVDRSATARSTLAFVAPKGRPGPCRSTSWRSWRRRGRDRTAGGPGARHHARAHAAARLRRARERRRRAPPGGARGALRRRGGRGRGRRGRGRAARTGGGCPPPRSSRCRACAAPVPPACPTTTEGFVPVDEHGRVAGCDRVFAAGDVTDFPLKQGGLAAQQADAAADAILAAVGYPIVPRPFRPVLRGVLYTDHDPAYLRAPTPGADPEPQSFSLWWPPSKVAGRHLSPYLTIRAGAPRAPEVRPSVGAVEVDVPLAYPVAATRPAFGAEALPPG